jgi:hypothetical protein
MKSKAILEKEFDTDVKDVKVTNGTADFTKYVALGNSLTSGYRDGALYLDGQNESYPSMIAQQMKLAGGAANFNQPLMDDNNGGLLLPTPAGNVQIFDTKLYISGITGGKHPWPVVASTPLRMTGRAII